VDYQQLMTLTSGTPYLLSLGLSKSKTSAVWVAGPLSGILVQPIIGAIADKSRSKWGRRRPFMIGGSIFVTFCLLVLAWAAEIIGAIVKDHDKVRENKLAYARWY
jgi:solute carrier family 45, member 1/2/4